MDDRCEFGCLVIGEYLYPLGCQLLPDRCGGVEAPILPGLAEQLVLHGLWGAERTQDLDEEALFC